MTKVVVRLIPAVCLVLAATKARAQHDDHAKNQLGTVHFATSCDPKVSADFDRALAFLHSFEFAGSIRGFSDVLAQDSTCAMAQWGIALSRWSNPMAAGNRNAGQLASGREAATKARALATTPRERAYVAAVNE